MTHSLLMLVCRKGNSVTEMILQQGDKYQRRNYNLYLQFWVVFLKCSSLRFKEFFWFMNSCRSQITEPHFTYRPQESWPRVFQGCSVLFNGNCAWWCKMNLLQHTILLMMTEAMFLQLMCTCYLYCRMWSSVPEPMLRNL